jgi:DNA-binding transcriptional regulator YiaG
MTGLVSNLPKESKMSRVETNEQKRVEMRQHIIRLRRLGWTTAQLATWMRVTPGTVRAWGAGDSMGTNAQRNTLSKLKSPHVERLYILDTANSLEREADASENLLEEDLAQFPDHAGHAEERRARNRIARIRLRVVQLRELFA